MGLSNQRIDEDQFLASRQEVLNMYKTGAQVNLEEAIAYCKAIPAHKNLTHQLREARKNETVIMHNLSGMATIEMHRNLLSALQDQGGAGLLHCIYDSLTRTCRFDESERLMKESEKTGKNMLNGFPVVAYGVKGCRELFESLDRPISALGPSIDSRLCTEIAMASGFSELVLNTFTAFETYTKTVPLEEIIGYHQYAARLASYYQDHGIDICCVVPNGPGGDNAPGIAPPSLGTAGNILGALMCAGQGLKYLVFDYHSHGNLAQDAASCFVRLKLAKEYLEKLGYHDIECYLENGQLGGQYPQNFDQARIQVAYGASISAVTNAEVCQVKTYDESSNIPTLESQVSSLIMGKMMYDIIKTQHIDFRNMKEIQIEMEEEEKETRAIVDKVLELGDGDPMVGSVKAYELGVLDNPVASNPRVAMKTVGIKDLNGAVRYLNTGNLPFTQEMKDFHLDRLNARAEKLGHKLDFDTLVADMRAIAAGEWISKK
ncbi:MAG: hypothetical protein IKR11_03690 [Solobacterium sp.]|nr:hypothetical protein [Lachnospiraceae bacterium]MBR4162600.1 hypothetical protein [Solobacterium sp.]